MTFGEFMPYVMGGIALANAVATLFLWLRRPGDDAQKTANQAAEAVASLRGALDVVEERLKHMPTSDELTELEGTVKAINSTLESVRESQDLVRRTVARIEDFLLRKS